MDNLIFLFGLLIGATLMWLLCAGRRKDVFQPTEKNIITAFDTLRELIEKADHKQLMIEWLADKLATHDKNFQKAAPERFTTEPLTAMDWIKAADTASKEDDSNENKT